MPTSSSDLTWREFTESHGYFRIQIPTTWQVEQSDAPMTSVRRGRHWEGRRYLIILSPPPSGEAAREMSMTLQVQHFADAPPNTSRRTVLSQPILGFFGNIASRRIGNGLSGPWVTCGCTLPTILPRRVVRRTSQTDRSRLRHCLWPSGVIGWR